MCLELCVFMLIIRGRQQTGCRTVNILCADGVSFVGFPQLNQISHQISSGQQQKLSEI